MLCAPRVFGALAALTAIVDRVIDTHELEPLPSGARRPRLLVNLHGRGPESHRLALDAAPQRLVAFAHADVPETGGMPEWRANEHEVERWCRLLSESGIAADRAALDLETRELPIDDDVLDATLIHPGAASAARRWPVERFAAVARAERAAGRRILVTGSPAEVDLAGAVADADSGDVDLAGRTDLVDLAAAVAGAGRVVCGDTGVAHLATALGTPSVLLFGPTPPSWWGPPADRPWHRVLWGGQAGDPHAGEPCPGLLLIEPDQVIDALALLPAAPDIRRPHAR